MPPVTRLQTRTSLTPTHNRATRSNTRIGRAHLVDPLTSFAHARIPRTISEPIPRTSSFSSTSSTSSADQSPSTSSFQPTSSPSDSYTNRSLSPIPPIPQSLDHSVSSSSSITPYNTTSLSRYTSSLGNLTPLTPPITQSTPYNPLPTSSTSTQLYPALPTTYTQYNTTTHIQHNSIGPLIQPSSPSHLIQTPPYTIPLPINLPLTPYFPHTISPCTPPTPQHYSIATPSSPPTPEVSAVHPPYCTPTNTPHDITMANPTANDTLSSNTPRSDTNPSSPNRSLIPHTNDTSHNAIQTNSSTALDPALCQAIREIIRQETAHLTPPSSLSYLQIPSSSYNHPAIPSTPQQSQTSLLRPSANPQLPDSTPDTPHFATFARPSVQHPPLTLPSHIIPFMTQTHRIPVNILAEFQNHEPSLLTQDEFRKFAAIPLHQLTESQVRRFTSRLDTLLSSNQSEPQLQEEAQALRTLLQNIEWKTIARWTQLYVNPEVKFSYSKIHYWRQRLDHNAARCYLQPSPPDDINTHLSHISKTLQQLANPNTRPSPFINLNNQRFNNNNNNSFNSNNSSRNRPPNNYYNRNPNGNNTYFRNIPSNNFLPFNNTNRNNTYQNNNSFSHNANLNNNNFRNNNNSYNTQNRDNRPFNNNNNPFNNNRQNNFRSNFNTQNHNTNRRLSSNNNPNSNQFNNRNNASFQPNTYNQIQPYNPQQLHNENRSTNTVQTSPNTIPYSVIPPNHTLVAVPNENYQRPQSTTPSPPPTTNTQPADLSFH